MGNWIAKISELFNGTQELRALMVGLDAAGKTTVLYKLHLGEIVTTIPTIGFNVETVNFKNLNFTVWDIGGQERLRTLWRHYYDNVQAVIFVLDSSDQDRIDTAREELMKLLGEYKLRDAVFLIYANKQDLPGSLPASEITSKLDLHRIQTRRWFVQSCCATTGAGLYEGLDWVSSQTKRS